jgi:hypothetical protein
LLAFVGFEYPAGPFDIGGGVGSLCRVGALETDVDVCKTKPLRYLVNYIVFGYALHCPIKDCNVLALLDTNSLANVHEQTDVVVQDVVVLSSIAIFLPPHLVARYHNC